MAKKSKPAKKAKARAAAPAKKSKVATKPVKSVKPVPDGYRTITPHIILDDAAKAIEFYQKAFGAKERMRMPGPGGKIVHAEVTIGDRLASTSRRRRRDSPPARCSSTSRTWTQRSAARSRRDAACARRSPTCSGAIATVR